MIKRYFADKDTTITNGYDTFMSGRKVDANMGASDILEAYALYGRYRADTSYNELSRILVNFDNTDILADVAAGTIDLSRDKVYFRLFNAVHGETLPSNYTLEIYPLTKAWDEGIGLDMEDYEDEGGASWDAATDSIDWTSDGGDYDVSRKKEVTFDSGDEDIELDITDWVTEWNNATLTNYGFIIKNKYETTDDSYYTKRFFARKSENFFKRPVLEARIALDTSTLSKTERSEADGRDNFYFSSSLASASDNANTIYLYNAIRGELKDIPGQGDGTTTMYCRLYNQDYSYEIDNVAVSWVRTGVYSAVFTVDEDDIEGLYTKIHDRWFESSTSTDVLYDGDITPKTFSRDVSDYSVENEIDKKYVINIRDLRRSYRNDQEVKFRMFARDKNWKPNMYVSYTENYGDNAETIDYLYYRLHRISDEEVVIDYSNNATVDYSRVPYDSHGNYLTLDMGILEPEYMYGLTFMYKSGSYYHEYPSVFKFRVDKVEGINEI
jgi:hypothetical protein